MEVTFRKPALVVFTFDDENADETKQEVLK